jgi:cell division transport system permease protein
MSFAKLTFFFTEAITNLKRSVLTTFITISTIAIALTMMGAFLFITMNLEAFLHQMQADAFVTVYLKKEAILAECYAFNLRIADMEEVADAKVVTPDEAVKELFADPDEQKLLQIGVTQDDNPLPTTIRIKLKDPVFLQPLLDKIKNEPLVDNLGYGEELYEQFKGLSGLLWHLSLAVVILLGAASMFIVFNTVRLTLFMRKEEVIIMKLVGATDWFVRGPFVIEGLLEGFFGSIIAAIVLLSSYHLVVGKFEELVPFFGMAISFDQLVKLTIKLFMMGLVLGAVGSLISLRDIKQFSKANIQGS